MIGENNIYKIEGFKNELYNECYTVVIFNIEKEARGIALNEWVTEGLREYFSDSSTKALKKSIIGWAGYSAYLLIVS